MFAPFSLWWFVLLAAVVAGLILTVFLFRKSDRRAKRRFLTVFSLLTLLYWTLYKVALSQYPGYDFNIWQELPLHLCNLAMPIAAVAAAKDSRLLQSVCFFACTLGAVLAVLAPSEGFSEVPFLSPQGIGYWGFHFAVLYIGLAFVVLGIYQPSFRDILPMVGTLLVLACVMHGVNLLMRATVYSEANYLYTFGLQGNPVADFVYGLLPVPLLCALPFAVLVIAVDALLILITLPFRRHEKAPMA